MKAVILAGGKGTRLRPLTHILPKVMVPVGRKPLLAWTIEHLSRQGIRDFILAVNYLGDLVKQYFGDGSSLGVSIKYVEEKDPLGTAGCLKNCKNELDSTFLMLNGDILSKFDLKDMLAFHTKQRGIGTMALVEVETPVPYGVLETKDHQITAFREKPILKHHINAGMYLLEKEILRYVPDGPSFMERDVFPTALESGEKLSAYFYSGYWLDVTNPADYEKATKEVIDVFSE